MFAKGREYRRHELHERYGGQRQGGISTPAKHPIIMLFTGTSGASYGYEDGWTPSGIFQYTGEGQLGDMQFLRGNRAIRDHVADGKALYLFEATRKGHVEYVGQFICVGYHIRQAPDLKGNLREAIVFELRVIEYARQAIHTSMHTHPA